MGSPPNNNHAAAAAVHEGQGGVTKLTLLLLLLSPLFADKFKSLESPIYEAGIYVLSGSLSI